MTASRDGDGDGVDVFIFEELAVVFENFRLGEGRDDDVGFFPTDIAAAAEIDLALIHVTERDDVVALLNNGRYQLSTAVAATDDRDVQFAMGRTVDARRQDLG